jgi:hypothetical protein
MTSEKALKRISSPKHKSVRLMFGEDAKIRLLMMGFKESVDHREVPQIRQL